MAGATDLRKTCTAAVALGAISLTMTGPALAASACSFEPQGEGRASAIIEARSFRMDDGSEERLAGIETVAAAGADGGAALGALVAGRDVSLRGATDAPDRYGR